MSLVSEACDHRLSIMSPDPVRRHWWASLATSRDDAYDPFGPAAKSWSCEWRGSGAADVGLVE